jgi:hypothetical protein
MHYQIGATRHQTDATLKDKLDTQQTSYLHATEPTLCLRTDKLKRHNPTGGKTARSECSVSVQTKYAEQANEQANATQTG